MRKTSKNRRKIKKDEKVKVTKTKRRSPKKLNKKVLGKSKSLNALSCAQELFASLSLTQREEHELLQKFFVSALEKGIKKRGSKSFSLAGSIVVDASNKDIQAGLAKADEKIGKVLSGSVNSDSGGGIGSRNTQQKYENVESILKYNEAPNDRSGVKLVIMNFND